MIKLLEIKIETDRVLPLLFAKDVSKLDIQGFWKFINIFSEIATGYKDAIDNYLDSYYYEDDNGNYSEENFNNFMESLEDNSFRNQIYYQFVDYIKDHKHVFYCEIHDYDENFYLVFGQNEEEESTYGERKNFIPEYLTLINEVSKETLKENNLKNVKIKFKEYYDHIEFSLYTTKVISEEMFYEIVDGEIFYEIFTDERVIDKFANSEFIENHYSDFKPEFISEFKNKIFTDREGSSHIKVLPILEPSSEGEGIYEDYEKFLIDARKILGQKTNKIMNIKENRNIVLTNEKLSNLVENVVKSLFKENVNEAGLNFNKAFYNADTKKITAAYYLIEETEDTYKILNVKEKKMSYSDDFRKERGHISFYLYEINYIDLPKSKAVKLDEYPTQQGFYYFEMPYSFYKQNNVLKVDRINAAPDFKYLVPEYGKTYAAVRDLKKDTPLYNYLVGVGFNLDHLIS